MPAAAALVAAGLLATPAAASPAKAPLAAADLTPSVEALPTVQIDKGSTGRNGAVVWSQATVGNTVYVGGDFTVARPAGAKRGTSEIPRTHLLAYDITTGNLDESFNHTLNGQVRGVAASPDGKRVYITGDFTQVDGKNRTRVAAFNTADGSLVSDFRPVLGANGLAIVASNSTVYVGGNFTKVGQVAGGALVQRNRLAAFSATDGSVSNFKADANAPVQALALTVAGDRLAAGGRFSTLSGTTARGMGSVDPTTGASQSFPVNQSVYDYGNTSAITSLYADATGIYGTGYQNGGTGNLEGTFRADPGTGKLVWLADCYGDTYSVFQTGGVVWDASHHHDCASIPGGFKDTHTFHHGTAYTVDVAGTNGGTRSGYAWSHKGKPAPKMLSGWFPKFTIGYYTGMNQGPWSVTGNSQYVSYGGEFQAVNNNKIQQGLVRFLVPGGGGVGGGGAGDAGGGAGGGAGAVEGGFTVTTDGLGVFCDASALGAKKYWWDMGNGPAIGDGAAKMAYTYREAGTYSVTLVATDAKGKATTYVQKVTVSKAGAGAVGDTVASDAFGRQAASGWGDAAQGGAWKPDTKPAYFSADGNRGLITIAAAGWTSQARLADVNQADVDINVQAGVTKRPTTGMTRIWTSARTSADFKSAYLLRANVNPSGQVESLQVIKRVAGAETVIGTASPGLTLGAGDLAQLRLRVVGDTIQGKVWKAGATEPASWQVQVTDTAVKTTGSVGLGAYTGASATPLPVTVAFDNLNVTKAG